MQLPAVAGHSAHIFPGIVYTVKMGVLNSYPAIYPDTNAVIVANAVVVIAVDVDMTVANARHPGVTPLRKPVVMHCYV